MKEFILRWLRRPITPDTPCFLLIYLDSNEDINPLSNVPQVDDVLDMFRSARQTTAGSKRAAARPVFPAAISTPNPTHTCRRPHWSALALGQGNVLTCLACRRRDAPNAAPGYEPRRQGLRRRSESVDQARWASRGRAGASSKRENPLRLLVSAAT